jgi:hypothetical protein
MQPPPNRWRTVTFSQGSNDQVTVTSGRLDPSAGRMVFTHEAFFIGDLRDEREFPEHVRFAAQCIQRRLEGTNPGPGEPPQGG